MDIESLMRPFEGSQVKQRVGPGKRPLDYVSGTDVIRRLLDATDNRFSWNVEKVEMVTQETASGPVAYWVVSGTLSLGDLGYRAGVGTHQADSVEAAKAAETDALKRAAVKFGVGLHLYEEDHQGSGGNSASPPNPRNGNNVNNGGSNGGNGYPRPATGNGSRAASGYGVRTGMSARPTVAEPDEDSPF